ncbi:MAG: hypothetical protein QM756_19950 [Polyangiaceae bacterium]
MNASTSKPHSNASGTTRGLFEAVLIAVAVAIALLLALRVELVPTPVEIPALEPLPQRLDQPARP